MSSKAEIVKSKYLSWSIRHGLIELGLISDSEGFVKLNDLLNKANQSSNNKLFTTEEVLQIVKNCPKQRFGIKMVDSELYIRANQGHSKDVGSLINSDELLVKLNEPIEGVFHGTYKKHIESHIPRNGIILDIACGDGLIEKINNAERFTGNDIERLF